MTQGAAFVDVTASATSSGAWAPCWPGAARSPAADERTNGSARCQSVRLLRADVPGHERAIRFPTPTRMPTCTDFTFSLRTDARNGRQHRFMESSDACPAHCWPASGPRPLLAAWPTWRRWPPPDAAPRSSPIPGRDPAHALFAYVAEREGGRTAAMLFVDLVSADGRWVADYPIRAGRRWHRRAASACAAPEGVAGLSLPWPSSPSGGTARIRPAASRRRIRGSACSLMGRDREFKR